MLTGKVAIITGGSRGIGQAIALRLAKEGAHVIIAATTLERIDATRKLAEGLPGSLTGEPTDVSDPAAVTRLIERAEREHGQIDLIVNNAGIAEDGEMMLWETDVEEWWRVIEVNLRGPMLTMHAAIPGMLRRGTGRIVNIGSLRNITAIPIHSAYGASKAGLTRLTNTVEAGLAGTGVRLFELSPGRVRTDIITPSMLDAPDHTWTPIDRVAEIVVQIALGDLDELSGRFLHARDDFEMMSQKAAEIIERNGRVLTLAKAYDGDPLRYPGDLPSPRS